MEAASAEAALALYRERINRHRFDDLVPLIAPDAIFWFGDGSHAGLGAIRAAFEKTWAQLVDETYALETCIGWLQAMPQPPVSTNFTGGPPWMASRARAEGAAPAFWRVARQAGRSCTSTSAPSQRDWADTA
jgi:hypothetical protein